MPPSSESSAAEGARRCLSLRELPSTSLEPTTGRGQPALPPGVSVRVHVRRVGGFTIELRLPGATSSGPAPLSWPGQLWRWARALLRSTRVNWPIIRRM